MEKLYQSALKKHSSSPIGRGRRIEASHFSEGYNASCGDEIDFSLQLNPITGEIDEISFDDDSCAICTASASILCESSLSLTQHKMNRAYLELLSILDPENNLNNEQKCDSPITEIPESLSVLSPVAAHPSRINCALLPWQTALAAFNKPVAANKKNEPTSNA